MRDHYKRAAVLLIAASILSGCGPRQASDTVEWYYFDWLTDAPEAPVFQVRDTESSLGPYADLHKIITMKDIVKMHGHACDGLVTAACAMKAGLAVLYPDGVIDRTDTGCITKNSPCYGDVAAYLTGGRIRFGTQKIDPTLGDEFILYRFSTGQAVKISLQAGVFPPELAALERKIRAGDFTDEDMRACQQIGWDYARDLLQRPLAGSFELQVLPDMTWTPDQYEHLGERGDVMNKNR